MDLTQESFKEFIQKNEVAIVDFWAEWCMPCKMMIPVVDELSEEIPIAKVDTMIEKDLATEYEIRSIPAFVFFKNGEVVDTVLGIQKKEELINKYNELKGK